MNIVIMGLPGAGKGTQAEFIIEKYGVGHISTGNMMRSAIQSGSELGKELKGYLDQGNLVPDDLTTRILEAEISKPEYDNGFLLDGYPRNVEQVILLDNILERLGRKIDVVLYISIDEQIVINRITSRLSCLSCGATYNKNVHTLKVEGICDKCGAELAQRDDDKLETVENRIKVAKDQTIPVIDVYAERGLVMEVVTADETPEAVSALVDLALKGIK
ncbi:MAG: adenylate kinase [Mycoplasmatales bacterium]